ncbi:hypothetical protein [Paenibacillus montanisoli]|uniref:HTH merR-type domain-containing protein n=1 Tax=Paenibacillus montanisoli TaxID=2081970 RepID=A0A328U176_9BACL|nr:hypothetical protein [Paenibacillus montanisoli]RAP75812.1 hypothetical protein DL346_10245 [Paenibacillus montanisoli]
MSDIIDYEIRYSTKNIADMLRIESVTVRKYASALERAGYAFDRNTAKNRSYSGRDAAAFRFMHLIRMQSGVTVEAAALMTVQRSNAASTELQPVDRNEDDLLPQPYNGRYEIIASEVLKIRTEFEAVRDMTVEQTERLNRIAALSERYEQMVGFQKELMLQMQQLAAAEQAEELRTQRVNDQLIEHRIKMNLKRTALSIWNEKPERERTMKAGWFRRLENEAARESFIRNYIDDHYEEELRKAHGLEP